MFFLSRLHSNIFMTKVVLLNVTMMVIQYWTILWLTENSMMTSLTVHDCLRRQECRAYLKER